MSLLRRAYKWQAIVHFVGFEKSSGEAKLQKGETNSTHECILVRMANQQNIQKATPC